MNMGHTITFTTDQVVQIPCACVCLAGTVCGGHTHAWREGDRCDCQGGGVAQKPKSGNHTSSRVENHLKDMKAITRLKGAAPRGPPWIYGRETVQKF